MPSAGGTSQRGYGWQHQKRRKAYEPLVKLGRATCWRCGEPIHPDAKWDLGHDDHDRSITRGPEHVGRECPAGGNRATATRRSAEPQAPALGFFDT